MPLTDIQIRNAKPGRKPIRPEELDKRQNSQSAVTSTNGMDSNSSTALFNETDKPYKLADANGLYLEVDPSGGKYWRFKYRFEGKEKRLSLGVYPVVNLATARVARDECRKLLTKGIDPGIHRKAVKASRAGRDAWGKLVRVRRRVEWPCSLVFRPVRYEPSISVIWPAGRRRGASRRCARWAWTRSTWARSRSSSRWSAIWIPASRCGSAPSGRRRRWMSSSGPS